MFDERGRARTQARAACETAGWQPAFHRRDVDHASLKHIPGNPG